MNEVRYNLSDRIPFAEVTYTLPAQRFAVSCAISVEETLPIVSEFSIRLVYSCGSVTPSQLQSFFGFSDRETTIVIRSLLDERLVRWEDESITLTPYALAKFLESYDGVPRCVRIKEWSGDAIFELVSYSPIDKKKLSPTTATLPIPLQAGEADREARTTYWAERSFQEHFQTIVAKRDKMQIYKISEMEPKDRLSVPLTCTFMISLDGQNEITRSLPDQDLEQRPDITKAISDSLAGTAKTGNDGIVSAFKMFGAWNAAQFFAVGGFRLERFLDLVHVVKANPFVEGVMPITGSLLLAENRKFLRQRLALIAELGNAADAEHHASARIYWLTPDVPFWGRTLSTRSFGSDLRRLMNSSLAAEQSQMSSEEQDLKSPLVRSFIQPGRLPDTRSRRAYSEGIPGSAALRNKVLDGKVEVLWMPGRFMCMLYHYQTDHAVPVPVGFFSVAEPQLLAAQQFFIDLVFSHQGTFDLKNSDKGDGKNIDAELAKVRQELS